MYLFVFKNEKADTDELITRAAHSYCGLCYGASFECGCCKGCGFAENEEMPVIRRSENGKPYFEGENMPKFSLSHSGELAVVLFAASNVGVDIQKHSQVSASLKKKVCGSEDVSDDVFFGMWTRKEAYIKYSDGRLFETAGAGLPENLYFEEISVAAGYTCSVCCETQETIFIKEYT